MTPTPRCAKCGHEQKFHRSSSLDGEYTYWCDAPLDDGGKFCDCHAFVPEADAQAENYFDVPVGLMGGMRAAAQAAPAPVCKCGHLEADHEITHGVPVPACLLCDDGSGYGCQQYDPPAPAETAGESEEDCDKGLAHFHRAEYLRGLRDALQIAETDGDSIFAESIAEDIRALIQRETEGK